MALEKCEWHSGDSILADKNNVISRCNIIRPAKYAYWMLGTTGEIECYDSCRHENIERRRKDAANARRLDSVYSKSEDLYKSMLGHYRAASADPTNHKILQSFHATFKPTRDFQKLLHNENIYPNSEAEIKRIEGYIATGEYILRQLAQFIPQSQFYQLYKSTKPIKTKPKEDVEYILVGEDDRIIGWFHLYV